MGIGQRTAMSLVRMQRSKAEASGQQRRSRPLERKARSVSFSQIDSDKKQRAHSGVVSLQNKDQDHSLRLLQRLRHALCPLPQDASLASREYESLQDELQRLAEHVAQHKSRASVESWDDQTSLGLYTGDPDAERQPYRTLRIVSDASTPIEKLDVIPADLSSYRRPAAKNPAPVRGLTLVSSEKPTEPDVQHLLSREDEPLGPATARLTQQSLDAKASPKTGEPIRPELALSLLDS